MNITFDALSKDIKTSHLRSQSRLTDAAQQFEGILLQELLKPLRSGNGDEQNEGASDTISGFGIEAVAKSISQMGGLGIAAQVVHQLSPEDRGASKRNIGQH